MKKISVLILLLFFCMSVMSTVFAASATKEEIMAIPKTGMLDKPVELGDKELVAYRDEIVMVTVNKATKISTSGNFLMILHIMPTDVNKKSQGWLDFANYTCSRWITDKGRISASPVQVNEITYYIAVNETEATCKVYGFEMFNWTKKESRSLYKSVEGPNNKFMNPYVRLEDEVLFDAAYRKVVQWYKEH